MDRFPTGGKLYRLIYASSFSPEFPSTEAEQDVQIDKIIHTAVKHNREVGLTGLLLVYQRSFIQALEGPPAAVQATYRQILLDPRHENAVELEAGRVSARNFSKWAMCSRRLSKVDDEIIQALDLKSAFDPRRLTAAQALKLLTTVANIQSQHANVAE
jgi:hypothetical protein